jgi:hypothetical protein
MQDLGYELPRIPIPRTWVNKGERQDQSYYAPALPPHSRSSSENSLTSPYLHSSLSPFSARKGLTSGWVMVVSFPWIHPPSR